MKVRKAWVAQGFLGVAFLLWSAPVWAQLEYGPWSINGVYQYEIYGSTGHANPNNRGFPGSRGLQNEPGKPDFQLMQQTAELRIYGNLSENWSVYVQPRFWHDLTKSVDDHYIQYESLPHNFRGDGWMLRGGGNDGKAELWQAYIDYRTENLWVRAGKQSIAWGEDLALRILDQVDSLDLSQIFFFGRAFEEFERQRTPEWMLRVNYNIKNRLIPDLTLETLVSPGTWTPNILPEQGAPFNVVPAILAYRELTSMGRPIWGGRLIGSIGAAQFSLNVLSRPSSAGIALTDGIFPSVHGGVPLLAPLGDLTLYRVHASARHPRFYLFGGSLNYPWEWAGAVLRFETAVVPDSPFTNPSFQHIIERPVWQIFASVDRPTYLIPKLDSMFINMQFLETYTFGSLHGVRATGNTVDDAVQVVTLFLQQPLFTKRVNLEGLGAFDTGDGYWLQGGVHWEIGNHYRVDAYYNSFSGAEWRRFPGAFWWADGAYFRLTVGY